jgi:hypothetical protein
MLFWAAISFTVGPGVVAAGAAAAPNEAVATAVHPAMAIAAPRIVHRGRFKALSSRSARSVTASPIQQTPDARSPLQLNIDGLGNDSESAPALRRRHLRKAVNRSHGGNAAWRLSPR